MRDGRQEDYDVQLAGRTIGSGLDYEACHAGTLAEIANCSEDHLARVVRDAVDTGAGV